MNFVYEMSAKPFITRVDLVLNLSILQRQGVFLYNKECDKSVKVFPKWWQKLHPRFVVLGVKKNQAWSRFRDETKLELG